MPSTESQILITKQKESIQKEAKLAIKMKITNKRYKLGDALVEMHELSTKYKKYKKTSVEFSIIKREMLNLFRKCERLEEEIDNLLIKQNEL